MLPTLLSVALLSLAAQDTGAPIATSPTAPRMQPAAPSTTEAPIPAGAPSDDFGLVAWCHGALRGHMELAEQIKDALPLDEQQTAIGREYLASYETALAASPESKTTEGVARAATARATGYGTWEAARKSANRDTQSYTYLGWQLPGRCEHAAARLTAGTSSPLAAAPAQP